MQTYSYENMVKGIELLEQAVKVDTMFTSAYVQLASAYSDFGTFYRSGREEYPKARMAALRALELDDSQAGAYMALGMVQYTFEWDWSGAEQSFRQALDLDPDNADIHREYATYLTYMARFTEALAEYELAVDLDPLTMINHQNMGWAYYHAGRFDESIARFEKIIALLQEFPNPAKEKQIQRQLIWNYIMKGQYDRALTEIDAWEAKWQLTDNGDRAWANVAMGRREEVADLIADILSNPRIVPWDAAKLGDVDLAFRRLEELYQERNTYMIFLKMAIELESLRPDPRYEDLLHRMNFSD